MKCVIFDMDGVITDNHEYNIKSWIMFLEHYGKKVTHVDIKRHINGKRGIETIDHFFGSLNQEKLNRYAAEKEKLYRELYSPYVSPLKGLVTLLNTLKHNKIAIGLGTSAPIENVELILGKLRLYEYFDVVVHGGMIKKGKPDPETYLLVAKKLNQNPANCIVFEDSIAGISSAKSAGMRVIGVTTAHSVTELNIADSTIPDFSNLALDTLRAIADTPISYLT